MRTKTVNTDRRSITIAVVGSVLLGLCASSFAAADAKQKHYGLIFGTAYGPDDRPIYGVRVTIRPAGKKHPSWELMSDHRGEFAQHVPPGPGDYVVVGEVEIMPRENGKPQKSKKLHLKGETKVHIEGEERHDFSLHLAE
jgi:hypothetical protein